VPIALFAGGEDELADVQDIAWLKDQINTTVVAYQVI
jgi:hypothetical protein